MRAQGFSVSSFQAPNGPWVWCEGLFADRVHDIGPHLGLISRRLQIGEGAFSPHGFLLFLPCTCTENAFSA